MNARESIVTILSAIKTDYGIDSVYSHYADGHSLPYIAYIGAGQEKFASDNSDSWRMDRYQVELYFKRKEPSLEKNIEDAFIGGGWHISKSDDLYLDNEGIFYISYQLS